MDPTKPSSSVGRESLPEKVLVSGPDGPDGETRETDVNGTLSLLQGNLLQRGRDHHKFNTLGYQRRTKQKVVTGPRLLNRGASVAAKPRAALRQVLFSQALSEKNVTPEQRGQLEDLKQDLGTYAVPVSLKWTWNEDHQGATLEETWTEIVDSHSTMSKTQKHQQEALWEFVHTELTYINKLIVITDLVIAALVHLHQHGFLLEVTPELLFCNIPSILSAHQLFWQEVIYPMLHEVRLTGVPFDPVKLEAGCLQFHQRFSFYHRYCWEEEYNLDFARKQMENNPQFIIFVQWVETHPNCRRMRIGDMQANPHQRITKYPLLLKAILKNTQDPFVHEALRGMLSSVKGFLESINDYLKFKDEELALIISAQRVEGYEVEGINEEIDKHVREICNFSLTCPIRGVGAEVVRKLLLEETLKIRGRKDSKLELVALLFSDVLLMTKVQKKGERQKVVRPPLSLDRTYVIALKDGCSFLLIEVGELQSALNVYIFAASTPERCSTWVSAIRRAKETLRSWREKERLRQLESWKILQPGTEVLAEEMYVEEKPFQVQEETFVDEQDEGFVLFPSLNGMPESKEEEGPPPPPDDVSTHDKDTLSYPPSKPHSFKDNPYKVRRVGLQQAVKAHEWIEMGVRRQQVGIHAEEREKTLGSVMTNQDWAAWNESRRSTPNPERDPRGRAADPRKHGATGAHVFLRGEYPEIDYPMNEDAITPETVSTQRPESEEGRGEGGTSAKRDPRSGNQDTVRNSSNSRSREAETFSDTRSLSKKSTSPGSRRRRPITAHQRTSSQTLSTDSRSALSASFSNSDSDDTPNIRWPSDPSGQSPGSHRVLKLSSLGLTLEEFWNTDNKLSQTLSEPELPDREFYEQRPKMKTQRSASIPHIRTEGGHGPRLDSAGLYTESQRKDAQLPVSTDNPNEDPSPLMDLLDRATERVRLKRYRNFKTANVRSRYPPASPAFTTTPSQSPSDGDRDSEWEEEEELLRHRALTVSGGWKEQLVDGDDDVRDEKSDSILGVNVDWSGWCFDDNEVMDYLQLGNEGLLEGITQTLANWDLQGLSGPDDGEYSQV